MKTLLALLAMCSAVAAQDQQVGARTKAMGGSYTAFEDDPVSVWLNPAGIATQPDAMAVAYQTYTVYEVELTPAVNVGEDPFGRPATSWNDGGLIPSYLGLVFHVGTPESPQSFGFCFTAPYQLRFPVSNTVDTDVIGARFEQVFYRFRAAYARDFRFEPVGSEGFFTHLSAGIAIDLALSRLEFKEFAPDVVSGAALNEKSTDVGVGGGLGLLLGVYDNTRNFKVNLGLAYQSKVHFDFSISPWFASQFDWPNQYQAGLTAYLFEGMPLRITVDVQRIEWGRATADSNLPDGRNFEDLNNYSLGGEYALKMGSLIPGVTLYPRAGIRRYDAPWQSTNPQELPAIRNRRMVIRPKQEVFTIGSAGLGIGWTSEAGKSRTFDFAFDFGGDTNNFALGFTSEF
jgi:long-subunit fatty acid transport protein